MWEGGTVVELELKDSAVAGAQSASGRPLVLVVDDDSFNLRIAKRILEKEYDVAAVSSGKDALEYLHHAIPQIILLDLHMPELDGQETMRIIQMVPEWKKTPIIFLTADTDAETEKACFSMGAADYIVKPFVPMVMMSRVSRIIELYSLRDHLEDMLEEKTRQIKQMTLNSILAIANTIDARDSYTSGHSRRVADVVVQIVRELDWKEEEIHNIHNIALLHDIGKIGISDAILRKPARLTEEEFAIIKRHPTIGGAILKDLTTLKNVSDGALYHHERYDGHGYPFGLQGEDIPLCARIICVADSFDAMYSTRVYQKRLDLPQIIEEFIRCRGTLFDPKLDDLFVYMLQHGKLKNVR